MAARIAASFCRLERFVFGMRGCPSYLASSLVVDDGDEALRAGAEPSAVTMPGSGWATSEMTSESSVLLVCGASGSTLKRTRPAGQSSCPPSIARSRSARVGCSGTASRHWRARFAQSKRRVRNDRTCDLGDVRRPDALVGRRREHSLHQLHKPRPREEWPDAYSSFLGALGTVISPPRRSSRLKK